MASVDKVKVGDTTYDVSPSKDGTLNGYTSGDSSTPTSWTSVSAITTSDTNATIFSKLTSMVKNVRWLYTKLGTADFSATGSDTVSGALVSINNGLSDKAPSDHSHTVADLPVTSNQSNSTSTIPTCALLYSMNEELTAMEASMESIMESLGMGGGSGDPSGPSVDATDPNTRYESKNLGTWSSTSDVDTFMSKYNHANNYTGLSLGNYVTIQDGTYNTQWVIAGFDMEHNQTAADGTVYDNGYGICMIPKTYVTNYAWNEVSSNNFTGYKSSNMHNTCLPGIVTELQNVLGSHLIQRNVLLSSSLNGSTSSLNGHYHSSAYTWTTAYATLMSIGQMTGTFASHRNKYDDGEANYKLPLFNYENYWVKDGIMAVVFWTRCIWGMDADSYWLGYLINGKGDITSKRYNDINAYCVRPLIYLR